MPPLCYLNGKIIPVSEAQVSVYDIGLLRGFGIYEGLITHNRKLFMLVDHLERFKRSAKSIGIKIPATDSQIKDAMMELVAHNVPPGKEALIRIILTGGTTVGVIEYNYETPTMYMLVGEFTPLESRYLETGCSLSVVEYKRELAEIKSINYIKAVLLQKSRKEQSALEILYVSDGKVLEGAGSNVFIVKDGKLITPKDDIVLGITRKAVIDVAHSQFKIEEREISVKEMYDADEVFITGSFKEIVPVVKVGDKTIGNGKVGEVTKKVMELFHEFTRTY